MSEPQREAHEESVENALLPGATPGFYIAHHPWLDFTSHGKGTLHKVGFSGTLGRRLHDDSYITCFSPEWRFVATFETRSAESAHLLESAVLGRSKRPWGTELVCASAGDLIDLARKVSRELGIDVVQRQYPRYERIYPEVRRDAQCDVHCDALSATPCENSLDTFLDELLGEEGATQEGGATQEEGAAQEEHFSEENHVLRDLPDDQEIIDGIFLIEDVLEVEPEDGAVIPREYQNEAARSAIGELDRAGRCLLQMACRCGKTLVAYKIIEGCATRASGVARLTYILVPGLSLARQTVLKFKRYGWAGPMLAVGSDPVAIHANEVIEFTTNRDVIEGFAANTLADSPRLVVSTYQSSHLLPDVADLVIFDEAHRVCGGKEPRPFNHVLLTHKTPKRVYMTATPRYDGELSMKDRQLFGGVAYTYHMRRGINAGYVNNFHLELVPLRVAHEGSRKGSRENAGEESLNPPDSLNPPESLNPPGSMSSMASAIIAASEKVERMLVFCRSIRHSEELCREVERLLTAEGDRSGTDVPATLCLVAHSRMPSAVVAQTLKRFALGDDATRRILFNCRLFQEGVEIPALNAVFFAAPRHAPRDIIQSICRPLNVVPGKPDSTVFLPIEFNPYLAEDHPDNLKRFASVVPFIDALLDEDPTMYGFLLGDSSGEQNAVRVLSRANPAGPTNTLGKHTLKNYDAATILRAVKRAVRYGSSQAARPIDRLLRTERIPWESGFAQLRYTVEMCGRYPKTVDQADLAVLSRIGELASTGRWGSEHPENQIIQQAIQRGNASLGIGDSFFFSFHRWYRWAADEYVKWNNGEPSALEPYQARQLESLDQWSTYGVDGPYRWRESLDFLEAWVRKHGQPPMVEINRGGYIGLDATQMERLSGVLTTINQSDGKDNKRAKKPGSGFTVSAEKQKDLDELCDRLNAEMGNLGGHGVTDDGTGAAPAVFKPLRWRKQRDENGSLVENAKGEYIGPKTFIQEAFLRFKKEVEHNKKGSEYVNRWFPGYFEGKHNRQERQDVWDRSLMPPKTAQIKRRAG